LNRVDRWKWSLRKSSSRAARDVRTTCRVDGNRSRHVVTSKRSKPVCVNQRRSAAIELSDIRFAVSLRLFRTAANIDVAGVIDGDAQSTIAGSIKRIDQLRIDD